jgi:KaiC/GvpD/RAD55 family RecA-like ATPase
MHQIETGIPVLDRHLGGLRERRPYLVFGAPGQGKTLLGLQFLAAGLSRDEPGLLLTLDRPRDIVAEASHFGFDLGAAIDAGRLVVLEYDADITGKLLRQGWKPCLHQLQQLAAGAGVRRAVIDPIHPLFAGCNDEARLRADLRYLTGTLEEWGWTTLILAGMAEMQQHPALATVAAEVCWGTFELQSEMQDHEAQSYVFVHKVRGAADPRRRLRYRIAAPGGIQEDSAPEVSPAPERTAPRTVLLADDDPFILRLLAKHLEPDFRVLGAPDGLEALTLTVREKPDVVVLDVSLPKLSGFDVCRSLRECGFEMPIVFISGMAMDSNDRLRGLLLGGTDYIVKPFHAREVAEKIRAASRYRVDAPARPQADLERLLQAARRRTVSRTTFLEMCGQACEDASRYAAPMGLVRLGWDPGPDDEAVCEDLLRIVGLVTRPEDTPAVTGPQEILVLLVVEDLRGTLDYARKLRERFAATGMAARAAPVSISWAVYDPRAMPAWDLQAALRTVRHAPVEPLAAPEPSCNASTAVHPDAQSAD